MRDEKFERTMEAWAKHETSSAPEMRPTVEMYRMVEARRKPGILAKLLTRRAVWATAVASLMVLTVLYVRLYDPFMLFAPPPSQEVAYVGLRAGFAAQKGRIVIGAAVPSRSGPKGAPPILAQLVLQSQEADSPFVRALDLQNPPDQAVTLTSADNYRLVLEPVKDSYVYVFQLTSSGVLVKLFPNETYHPAQNPVRQGQLHYLPSQPNWFYLGQEKGEERLYIVASTEPLPQLEEGHSEYSAADEGPRKQRLLSTLVEALETIKDTRADTAAGWAFSFDHPLSRAIPLPE
jgi:hypothetical protein